MSCKPNLFWFSIAPTLREAQFQASFRSVTFILEYLAKYDAN
jgi:hypothetical protein